MANFLTKADSVKMLTDLRGRNNNPYGIEIAVTNTNPSGTDQKTTITVVDAGTTGLNADVLQKRIQQFSLFGVNGSFIGNAERTNELTYSGGSQAVTVAVQFFNNQLIIGYSAGY